MRFQLSIAVVALLPSAMGSPSTGKPSTLITNALPARAAEPLNTVPAAPGPNTPYFMATAFNAYMSRPGAPSDYSGAKFDLRMMHPRPEQRWTAKCTALTKRALCDGLSWRNCTRPGMGPGETLQFRLGEDMDRVDIRWHWAYDGQWFTAEASEPAIWVQKANERDRGGNMTVNTETVSFAKSEGWVFAWRSMVG
ncbi:hypothetical protein G6514_006654 [Epicoccum nigrum]|nr:hypothetical protein G6514_006654 [Epicoccum nigrum]